MTMVKAIPVRKAIIRTLDTIRIAREVGDRGTEMHCIGLVRHWLKNRNNPALVINRYSY